MDPPAKRPKLAAGCGTQKSRTSLFAPYRTIGLVSPTSIPFTSLPLGKTTFQITTSIGSNLQTYDLKKGLQLLFITSPQTPAPITATAAWNRKILAAWHSDASAKFGDALQNPTFSSSTPVVGVYVYQRGTKVGELECPLGCNEPITSLLLLGSWIVGLTASRIEVWNSLSSEHYTTIFSTGSPSICVCTMPTYLNKVFVGKQSGHVQIWNIKTAKLVHTILPQADFGSVTTLEPTPAISIIAIAYASGAVVMHNVKHDSPVLALNTFGNKNCRNPVTTISFRSDELGAGEDGRLAGVMATGSRGTGDIDFWDLTRGGKKTATLRAAHSPPSSKGRVAGGIVKLEFLPGQSVLISSGLDNALKSWIFDTNPFSPLPRQLHTRGGHSAPVTLLHFLGAHADGADYEGKWLLSASQDRSLWAWSLRRDAQNTEISQGQVHRKARKRGLLNPSSDSFSSSVTSLEDLKAPRITCIASSMNRDGGIGALPGNNNIWNNETGRSHKHGDVSTSTGWESLLTGHEGDRYARAWFWGRRRAGRWKFATSDRTVVRSVAVSVCGSFALVGSAGGIIDLFNLQSGIHRRRYPAAAAAAVAATSSPVPLLSAKESQLKPAGRVLSNNNSQHQGDVTGLIVDNLNKTVVSCGIDGQVKFWDFAAGKLILGLDWSPLSLAALRYHRPSDLIAIACSNGSVRVVDIGTKRLVRELWGSSTENVVDFAFSNNGAWILSVCTDSIMRVFDLATGHLIEAIRFVWCPVAIAFSPTGDFVAIAHRNQLGVSIYSNKALLSHISTGKVDPVDIISLDESPNSRLESEAGLADQLVKVDDNDGTSGRWSSDISTFSTIHQLSVQLVTLSLVPKTRWQTLLNLETIRQRNKPIDAPKKPESAPFFLTSIQESTPGLAESRETSVTANHKQTTGESRISKFLDGKITSAGWEVSNLLKKYQKHERDAGPLCEYLAGLSPSAADIAIRTLDSSKNELYKEHTSFLQALTMRLQQKRDFELVQTWTNVFLRCHAETVVESQQVKQALKELLIESKKESVRIQGLASYIRGVLNWVGGVV